MVQLIFGCSSFGATLLLLFISLNLKDSLGIRAEIRVIVLLFLLGTIFWAIPPLIFKDDYLDEIICLFVVQIFLMFIAMKLAKPLSMNNIPCTSYAKVFTEDAIILSVEFVKSHSIDFQNSNNIDDDDNCNDGQFEQSRLSSPRSQASMLNKFTDLLQDKDGFEYFANALVKEFAVEVKNG